MPEEVKRRRSTEGEALHDELGEVGLGGGGGAEGGGAGSGGLDGLDDGGKGMAEDHGSPGVEEVEVAVAVYVVEEGTFGAVEKGWIAADGAKGADGRVDSAREEVFGAVLELAGAGEGATHGVSISSGLASDAVHRYLRSQGRMRGAARLVVFPPQSARHGERTVRRCLTTVSGRTGPEEVRTKGSGWNGQCMSFP